MPRPLTIAALLLSVATAAGAQITRAEFAARRDSLAARVDSGVVVAFGGRTLVHDFNTFYQLPAFRYLTDFLEPDAVFVMVVRAKRGVSTLFLSPINPRTAFYYGKRADSSSSMRDYGVAGRPLAALAPALDSLAAAGWPFYTLADFEAADFAANDSLTRGQVFIRGLKAKYPSLAVKNAHPIVEELRARKSPAEMALLRKAIEISAEGHRAAMTTANPRHEYELKASIEATFARLGAERPAYGSIVGAGVNGTQLHYMKDMGDAKPGDMVVIDAAAEYRGYAADITRSIPVSGVFSPEQRAIYQLIREAQDVAERNSKVGMRPQVGADSSFIVRAKGLAKLGLIESEDATIDPPWASNCQPGQRNCTQAYLWMIHGITHGLGLEVHDPIQADFGDRTFKAGDVFVIEPGIYISTRALATLPDTPKNRAFIAKVRATVLKYENTGVRIEDDYILTDKGLERVSLVPREIPEIEALMRRARPVP